MLKYLTLVILLIGILLLSYAFLIEPYRPVVEKIEIASNQLGNLSKPVKIVQLSDLHIKHFGKYENRVVKKVNQLQPNLIVITGDLCKHSRLYENPQSSSFKVQLQSIVEFLNALKAQNVIYIVRGNNDFSDNKESSDLLLDEIAKTKAAVLTNLKEKIEVMGDTLVLAGIDFPDFYHEVVTDFYVAKNRKNAALVSRASAKNSYSHYYPHSRDSFKNYTYSGRMKQSSRDGGIGATFYSHLDRGYDRFYRIRSHPDFPEFHLSPHGTRIRNQKLNSGVIPKVNTWYCFKIKVENNRERTNIFAKIWRQDDREPAEWQIEAKDSSETRLVNGTFGVWSAKAGMHYFDDLTVYTENDTLGHNDFEHIESGKDPFQWIDMNFEDQLLPFLTAGVKKNVFTILLAHSPDTFLKTKELPVDLVLSGHTHGGQVRLPFIGAIYSQTALGPDISQGLFQRNHSLLYINRGIGTILIPVRFLCPPEITLFTLRPAEKSLQLSGASVKPFNH